MLPMLMSLIACPGFGTQDPNAGITVPENPTWDGDVEAILVSNCAACHGAPPNASGQADFRLDVYDDEGDIRGAFSQRDRILACAVNGEGGFMPQGSPSGPPPEDKAILEAWVLDGAPLTLDEVE